MKLKNMLIALLFLCGMLNARTPGHSLSDTLRAQTLRQDQVRYLPDSLLKKANANWVQDGLNGKANAIHAHSQYLLYQDTLQLFYVSFKNIADTQASHSNKINQNLQRSLDSLASHLSINNAQTDSLKNHNTRINSNMQKSLDSLMTLRIAINKNIDSLTYHNIRLNADIQRSLDSLSVHRVAINKNIDSLNSHNTRINALTDLTKTKLNIADTSNLNSKTLTQAQLNLKLNIADTLNKWQPKGSYQSAGAYLTPSDSAATRTFTNVQLAAKAEKTTTVNGHALSSNVTVTATDIGLGNVTNTSDANKPVSTAQQAALDLKANDNLVMKLAGTQTVTGRKSFSDYTGFGTTSPAQRTHIVGNLRIDDSTTLTQRILLNPNVVDGTTAVANTFDTKNTLSAVGAKLTQYKTGGVEKAFIDKDGLLSTTGLYITANPNIIASDLPNNYLIKDGNGVWDWFVFVARFNWDPVNEFNSTVPHPAFLDTNATGGVTAGFYWAKYEACNVSGIPRSLPGQFPWISVTYDTAVAVCDRKNPSGQKKFHLCTNAERAAVALLCRKRGTMPSGNNYYGTDYSSRWINFKLKDPTYYSNTSADCANAGGSGGYLTSSDYTPAGIFDLNGGVWEWLMGYKLIDSTIYIMRSSQYGGAGNNYRLAESTWMNTGATIRYNGVFASATLASGTDTTKLKELCIIPPLSGTSASYGDDYYYVITTGERLALFGGSWYYGTIAGVFSLDLYNTRTNYSASFGFRLAYVDL
jgi:formylglycine-generating enzyme